MSPLFKEFYRIIVNSSVNNRLTPESKGARITPFDSSDPYSWARYGPYPSVPTNRTDCEQMCSFVMFTRVLWRPLMKERGSIFIARIRASISTKKKKAKLHHSGSKDCTNEQMFRTVLFSGLRDQFVVRHYCHNPSDKCK